MTSSTHFPLQPQPPNASDAQQQQQQQQHSQPQQQSQYHRPHAPSPSPAKSPKNGLPFDPESMQFQFEQFVQDELYDSAQILGELLLSLAAAPTSYANMSLINSAHSSSVSNQSSHNSGSAASVNASMNLSPFMTSPSLSREFHAKTYALFADMLVGRREYKRAIQYYKKYWKAKVSINALAATSEAISIKLKIARCWMHLESAQNALDVLHSIPAPSRSLSVNLLLGKIYITEGLKNKAEEAYTMALRQNPYALEATLALTDLAASKESSSVIYGSTNSNDQYGNTAFRQREIERFYAKLSTLRPSNKFISRVDAVWMQTLVNAHINAKRGRYRAAMESFDSLEKLFPCNLHCLLHKGKLEMDEEYYHQAHLNFHKARQVDDQNLAMMDSHADCLRRNGARSQLNNLVHDLFETSDAHAESWLAAAFHSEMKGELETALQFCERAIMTNRKYAQAHFFRGTLLLQLNRPEHALVSFTTACKLNKSLAAYGGMIESYCELCAKGANKYKEALTTAKTVAKLYPQKARSFTLLGNVFAIRPENKESARKAFLRALTMEPRNLSAIFGLVDLLCGEGNLDHAIEKLQTLSDQCPREEVFTKLADMHTLNKQYPEAMTNYHRSLSLNPSSSNALRGLDRLEKLMRGEDPDDSRTTIDMEPEEHDESVDAAEYMAT
ncbi:TPA: hypothetical protein N0F65_003111 [Lagenidium giganteum]|uniref:Anaphase-promoting complex subunit 7 n=1 Tax=Lagenidium giganteum TaxID=4803 RepID=A0AAV2YVU8_9STRA|nr:TPA: hypothetical protein N0F65_003111 [Lagenidium giganteum]